MFRVFCAIDEFALHFLAIMVARRLPVEAG